MKTDAEVLTGAIESLEREGMWCQNAYYKYAMADGSVANADTPFTCRAVITDSDFTLLGECAEGAIRRSAGWFTDAHAILATILAQIARVEELVAKKIQELCPDVHEALVKEGWSPTGPSIAYVDSMARSMTYSLNNYNDHKQMTAGDIILAMKHVREEIA